MTKIFIVLIAFLIVGCNGKINPLDYSNIIDKRVTIPESCETLYKTDMPRVAVLPFVNHSTLKYNNDSKPLERAVANMVESIIMEMGGAKIYERELLDKILEEQKLQESGLIDEETAVNIGKLVGVNYIVTGTINNVEQNLKENSSAMRQASKSENTTVSIVGELSGLVTTFTDGFIIRSDVNVKILDVETGEIVKVININDERNIGKIDYPTYEQIVGGLGGSIRAGLIKSKDDFSKFFAKKGYIRQIYSKNGELIVQVNVGLNSGVKEGDKFIPLLLREIEDPLIGKMSCDVIKLPIELIATEQIQNSTTWLRAKGNGIEELMIGQLIERESRGEKLLGF